MKKQYFISHHNCNDSDNIRSYGKKSIKYLADEKAGIEYYQNGSYDKALASLKKAYGSGSMEAAYYLGEMYRQGNGVEKDRIVSCNYYQKSAEGGNRKAFFRAGTCHIPDTRDGEGFKETFKWFKKASEELKETDLNEGGKKRHVYQAWNYVLRWKRYTTGLE